MARTLSLIIRNVMFTIVVPGLGAVLAPWWILTSHGGTATVAAWQAVPVIVAGATLYAWCVWNFAAVGDGTPGLWDAPRRVVATGPYRWVRNPIYLAALLVILGEAWLFMSTRLLVYAAAMAAFCHLFVTGYEERRLGRRFGRSYLEYRRTVPRWNPAPAPAQLTAFPTGMLFLGSCRSARRPGRPDQPRGRVHPADPAGPGSSKNEAQTGGLPWQSSW